MIAHVATPLGHVAGGPGEAVGLLFVSAAAVFGFAALALLESRDERPHGLRLAQGAAVAAGVSVVLAYAFPFVIIRGPGGLRPSSTARLEILSPHPGQTFHGEPASVRCEFGWWAGR